MPFKRISLFLLFMWSMTHLHGQTSTPLTISEAYIVLTIDTNNVTRADAAIAHHNFNAVPFCVNVLAFFSDTSNIDTIHIKVGHRLGGNDVADLSFAYRGGSIASSISNFQYMGNGFFACVAPRAVAAVTLYLEIWAEDKLGNTTAVYRTQVN